jgi:hypothetical protein
MNLKVAPVGESSMHSAGQASRLGAVRPPPGGPQQQEGGKRAKRTAKKAVKPGKSAKPAAKRAARETVRAQAIAMLERKDGATLPELMKKFDWLPHTTRGFISILGSKDRLKIESFKTDKGVRTYRIKGGL